MQTTEPSLWFLESILMHAACLKTVSDYFIAISIYRLCRGKVYAVLLIYVITKPNSNLSSSRAQTQVLCMCVLVLIFLGEVEKGSASCV